MRIRNRSWRRWSCAASLRAAFDVLEDREREIVSLKFGAAISNREIAQVLNLTESNVGTILYRSLKKMKKQLEEGGI